MYLEFYINEQFLREISISSRLTGESVNRPSQKTFNINWWAGEENQSMNTPSFFIGIRKCKLHFASHFHPHSLCFQSRLQPRHSVYVSGLTYVPNTCTAVAGESGQGIVFAKQLGRQFQDCKFATSVWKVFSIRWWGGGMKMASALDGRLSLGVSIVFHLYGMFLLKSWKSGALASC